MPGGDSGEIQTRMQRVAAACLIARPIRYKPLLSCVRCLWQLEQTTSHLAISFLILVSDKEVLTPIVNSLLCK